MATTATVDTARLDIERGIVLGEIARTDTKASILLAALAIVTGPLAGHVTAITHRAWPIIAIASAGTLFAATATWLLMGVVLPRLHVGDGNGSASFLRYARCDRQTVREALTSHGDRLDHLIDLSKIAKAKYVQLARAGACLKAAGLLYAITAVLALAT